MTLSEEKLAVQVASFDCIHVNLHNAEKLQQQYMLQSHYQRTGYVKFSYHMDVGESCQD